MVQVQGSSPPSRLGRYRLIAQLGQGGMGTIHLAVAEGLGGFRKLFVIKELRQELSDSDQFLDLFLREARLAARLNHPNVVHTIEADQEGDRCFLVMEFLDGRPFNEILRGAERAPVVPLALRLQVICHALTGLHHAHELTDYDGKALHVVHRDVSPANVFVTYDGQVKVLDFGIAKANNVEGTQPGSFKGKIGYAAPEQLRLQPADRRTDVFACGVMLWEAIALRHLVRGKASRQVFEARLLGTEPRIGQQLAGVDPRLAQICDRAMCADPALRYPSAAAFCTDLQGFLTERNMSVDATSIAELLRTKFASERDTLHRLIEAQLCVEGDPDSIVMRRRGPPAARLEGVHEVTHMPEHAETGLAPSIKPPSPLQQKPGARLLGALALVALTGATLWRLRTDAKEDSPAPARAYEQSAPTVSSPASAPISDTASRAVAAKPDASDSTASRTPPGSETVRGGHVAPPVVANQTAHAGVQASGSARAQNIEAGGSARAQNKQPRKRVETKGVTVLGEPAARSLREAGAERAPTENGAGPAPLDVDLRSIQRVGRRALDVDNPFH